MADRRGVDFTGDMRDPSGEPVATVGAGAETIPIPESPTSAPAADVNPAVATDWLRWQLVDSAFPTGGFAHSSGLEAAWQHDEVRNREDFRSWLTSSLRQLTRGSIPWVNAAHAQPGQLEALDRHCDAFLSNHVANRASRLQGRALQAAGERIFQAGIPAPPLGHFAPLFGALTAALRISHPDAVRLFVQLHLRGVIAAAVRLNIVGPMEGQILQFQFATIAEAVSCRGLPLTLADLAQTAPLLDLWQGAQDRLYSRLFQS